MSKDIKVGDLVMVVKPTTCCGRADGVGVIFTVVKTFTKYSRCGCGSVDPMDDSFAQRADGKTCEKYRLIKIDPPPIPEEITNSQDLEQIA